MKIIELGEVKPSAPPFWVGLIIKCPHCNTKYELEENDSIDYWQERRINGKRMVSVNCPHCKTKNHQTL